MAFFNMVNLVKSERINKALTKMEIHSFKDVIFHLPYNYEDFSLTTDPFFFNKQKVVLEGKISSSLSYLKSRRIDVIRFRFTTNLKRTYDIVAFNRAYLKSVFKYGDEVTLVGVYDEYKRVISLTNIMKGNVDKNNLYRPLYHLNKDIANYEFIRLVDKAFKLIPSSNFINTVPEKFSKKYKLIDKYDALKLIHHPLKKEDVYKGLRVLKYEEALRFSLKTQLIRSLNEKMCFEKGKIDIAKVDDFIGHLPYKLTKDQDDVVQEILLDLNKEKLMYRLLQGDVGSGKTLVAMIALYANYLRGDQGAFMAPTDALAKQHYLNLIKLFKPLNINVVLLSGTTSIKDRVLIRKALTNKDIDILVGTHILFSKDINYISLGLAIIDEQHKFGVNQRMQLLNKGTHADLLLMSATPIPRTLALTLYGDLDVSTLNSFPTGKREITTKIVKSDDKYIFECISASLKKNKRIYIVAPRIDLNYDNQISVEELYKQYLSLYPGKVSLLHGHMDSDDKDFALKDFYSGKSPILISTSVIEVGIDVKEADLIIIYNAINFGLASLHQLRGRVGRDGSVANCLLIYDGEDVDDLDKLNVLVKSNDGFYVAEEDLRRRGPGELSGIRQSGLSTFAYLNLVNDFKMFEVARDDAKYIMLNKNDEDFSSFIKSVEKEIEDKKEQNFISQ